MIPELLPCPCCPGEVGVHLGDEAWAYCTRCHCSGPTAAGYGSAVEAWNEDVVAKGKGMKDNSRLHTWRALRDTAVAMVEVLEEEVRHGRQEQDRV